MNHQSFRIAKAQARQCLRFDEFERVRAAMRAMLADGRVARSELSSIAPSDFWDRFDRVVQP